MPRVLLGVQAKTTSGRPMPSGQDRFVYGLPVLGGGAFGATGGVDCAHATAGPDHLCPEAARHRVWPVLAVHRRGTSAYVPAGGFLQ